MTRLVGVVCAGVLLLAAGCLPDSFRLPFSAPPSSRFVVAGSVGQVEAHLQEALAAAGVGVVRQLEGDDLRLAGKTSRNIFFCIHLRPQSGPGEEKTRITVQWDRWDQNADEEFLRTVVQPLTTPAPG
jgi:hypothetical protein